MMLRLAYATGSWLALRSSCGSCEGGAADGLVRSVHRVSSVSFRMPQRARARYPVARKVGCNRFGAFLKNFPSN